MPVMKPVGDDSVLDRLFFFRFFFFSCWMGLRDTPACVIIDCMMNVINMGSMFDVISGEDISIGNRLPATTLKVICDSNGFHLMKTDELHAPDYKVYGNPKAKVDKIFRKYDHSTDNTGVILSGDKGTGKTLLTRELADEAMKRGMPVIICDVPYEGLADFIQSVDQNAMILFDEFEKTFSKTKGDHDSIAPQDSLLSMFDGLSNTHHLNVLTVNNITRLSDYMLNRPGRFHYHIRFTYPTAEEIKEYLTDNLPASQCGQIEKVISFSRQYPLSYDCLSAISDELQYGDDFNDAIKDLNIINYDMRRMYKYVIELDDGTRINGRESLNTQADDNGIYFSYKGDDFGAYFDFSDAVVRNDCDVIEAVNVDIDGNGDNKITWYDDNKDAHVNHVRSITLQRVFQSYDFRAV